MRESEPHDVTLQISASEETAFMELLQFMYSNNLGVTAASAVLDVLIAANKFDVASCIRHCIRLLRNLPMTPESVLVYLDLPPTILMSEAFQSLTVAAKQFYVVHFKDMTKFDDDNGILSLPLAGVEAIIASDVLQVRSEDSVYCLVVNWARAHYPKFRERRAVIATRLAKFIRYPYMTHIMLAHLLTNKDFDRGFAKKVVREAIAFKAEVPHKQHTYIIDKSSGSILNRWLVERAYEKRPIKMVKLDQPRPQCVVYLDLKREICANLFPSESVISEDFNFYRGQKFFLWAHCNMDRFELRLGMRKRESCFFMFDFVVAVRSKPGGEYVSIYETVHTCDGGTYISASDNFYFRWNKFIGEDSDYFIDGVLHIKAELIKVST